MHVLFESYTGLYILTFWWQQFHYIYYYYGTPKSATSRFIFKLVKDLKQEIRVILIVFYTAPRIIAWRVSMIGYMDAGHKASMIQDTEILLFSSI